MTKLTAEEKRAVASLKRLAKKWPKSLWLFSAAGSLHVMKKVAGRKSYLPMSIMAQKAGAGPEGVNPDAIVDTINIENDGGDF